MRSTKLVHRPQAEGAAAGSVADAAAGSATAVAEDEADQAVAAADVASHAGKAAQRGRFSSTCVDPFAPAITPTASQPSMPATFNAEDGSWPLVTAIARYSHA